MCNIKPQVYRNPPIHSLDMKGKQVGWASAQYELQECLFHTDSSSIYRTGDGHIVKMVSRGRDQSEASNALRVYQMCPEITPKLVCFDETLRVYVYEERMGDVLAAEIDQVEPPQFRPEFCTWIAKHRKTRGELYRKTMLHAILALHKLHKFAGMVHMDFKLENLVYHFKEDGSVAVQMVDLADALPIDHPHHPSAGMVGTAQYMAIEMIENPHTYRSGPELDIWALGVSIINILSLEDTLDWREHMPDTRYGWLLAGYFDIDCKFTTPDQCTREYWENDGRYRRRQHEKRLGHCTLYRYAIRFCSRDTKERLTAFAEAVDTLAFEPLPPWRDDHSK